MENVAGVKKKSKGKENRYGKRYGFEFKLRCVKLRLEEKGFQLLCCRRSGASKDVIRRWAKAYQERGEAGYGIGLSRQQVDGSFRSGTREDRRDQEARASLWCQADIHLLKLHSSSAPARRRVRRRSRKSR